MGRQESVGPVRRAPLRIGVVRQHDESGQVLVLGAQPVGDPRADSRVTAEAIAGVDVVQGCRVVDGLRLEAAIEADIVHAVGEIAELGVDLYAELPRPAELERTPDEVPLAGVHARFELVALLDELGHVQVGELGLGIEGVDVARAAFHQQEDAVLGFGLVMPASRSEDAGPRGFPVQQSRERDRPQAQGRVVQELPARRSGGDDRALHGQYTYTNSLELNRASARSARARVSGCASLGCGLCS